MNNACECGARWYSAHLHRVTVEGYPCHVYNGLYWTAFGATRERGSDVLQADQ